uniref:Uncharacterized protein n=1 Tax=Oryza meridionalis TaxID=40149 RepID=A0A0E0CMB4_9ORYZ
MAGALLVPPLSSSGSVYLNWYQGEDVDFFFFPFLVLYKCVHWHGHRAGIDGPGHQHVVQGLLVELHLLNLANLTAGKRSGNKAANRGVLPRWYVHHRVGLFVFADDNPYGDIVHNTEIMSELDCDSCYGCMFSP